MGAKDSKLGGIALLAALYLWWRNREREKEAASKARMESLYRTMEER